jgi:hypothetical protein
MSLDAYASMHIIQKPARFVKEKNIPFKNIGLDDIERALGGLPRG